MKKPKWGTPDIITTLGSQPKIRRVFIQHTDNLVPESQATGDEWFETDIIEPSEGYMIERVLTWYIDAPEILSTEGRHNFRIGYGGGYPSRNAILWVDSQPVWQPEHETHRLRISANYQPNGFPGVARMDHEELSRSDMQRALLAPYPFTKDFPLEISYFNRTDVVQEQTRTIDLILLEIPIYI